MKLTIEESNLLTNYLGVPWHIKAQMCGNSPLIKVNNGNLLTTTPNPYFGTHVIQLGAGAFGQVWSTTKNYAYKYMEATAESLKEISIMQYLNHQNLLCIAGMFETTIKSHVFHVIVMNEAHKGTLYDMYDKLKKFKILRKKAYYQILKGLAYLHSVYIVHNDIKPANIFVFTDGLNYVYKIGDFGISQTCTYVELDHSSNIVTKYWRPPEVFENKDEYMIITDKIDIWSVGVIIYDLIYNYKNFYIYAGKTEEEIFENIKDPNFIKQRVDTTTLFDTNEQALADLCLTIDPKSRPTAIQCLYNIYFKSVFKATDIQTIIKNDKSIPISVKNYNDREKLIQNVFFSLDELYEDKSEKVALTIGFYAMTLFDLYFLTTPIPDISFDNLVEKYAFFEQEKTMVRHRADSLLNTNMQRFINLYLQKKTDKDTKDLNDLKSLIESQNLTFLKDFEFIINYKVRATDNKKIYEELYGDIEKAQDVSEYMEYLKQAYNTIKKYYKFNDIFTIIIYIAIFYIDPEKSALEDLNFLNIKEFDSVKQVLINNFYVPTAVQYYTNKYDKRPDIDTLKKMINAFKKNPDQKAIVDNL